MTLLLVLLIGGFASAAAIALVRGLTAFVRDSEHIRQNGQESHEVVGIKQNRMMAQRVLFQGTAIVLIVLLGSLASQS